MGGDDMDGTSIASGPAEQGELAASLAALFTLFGGSAVDPASRRQLSPPGTTIGSPDIHRRRPSRSGGN